MSILDSLSPNELLLLGVLLALCGASIGLLLGHLVVAWTQAMTQMRESERPSTLPRGRW